MTETRASRPTYADAADFDLTAVSLGAGVQSTTLILLAAEGKLPKPDVAIFADTGWEPQAVYDHLERLHREVMIPAGIELVRVTNGNIFTEAPADHYPLPRLPLYVVDPANTKDSRGGTTMRQCTPHYKITPINREIRKRLGGKEKTIPCPVCDGKGHREPPPWMGRAMALQGKPLPDTVPCSQCHGTRFKVKVSNPPRGKRALQWVGFSTDEVFRVADSRVGYAVLTFPLLDLGMSRKDCQRYLNRHGWGETTKSACIGCPYHNNAMWRDMRDNRPDEWASAVAFDESIRTTMRGLKSATPTSEAFVHRSMKPLAEAPINHITAKEWNDRQGDLLDLLADAAELEDEEPDSPGCSPYGCVSEDPFDRTPVDGEDDDE